MFSVNKKKTLIQTVHIQSCCYPCNRHCKTPYQLPRFVNIINQPNQTLFLKEQN